MLEIEFAPTFSTEDLINLPRYSIYIKLLIDGTTSKPFRANTVAIEHRQHLYQDYIKKESIRKYSDVCNRQRLEPYQEFINDEFNIPKQQRLDFG
jgi:hypothetical protein